MIGGCARYSCSVPLSPPDPLSALLCPPRIRRSVSKNCITWASGPLASIWVQPISGGDQSTGRKVTVFILCLSPYQHVALAGAVILDQGQCLLRRTPLPLPQILLGSGTPPFPHCASGGNSISYSQSLPVPRWATIPCRFPLPHSPS